MNEKHIQKLSKERFKAIYQLLNNIGMNKEQMNLIKKNEVVNLAIINEALTHTSKNLPTNHERLEFLGDAVLRLAASEYIEENHPKLKVGDRSALRAQLVSDKWLGDIGEAIQIKNVMLIGIKADKDKAAIKTIEAEGTEALIGAIYECLNNLEVIKNWLSPYWNVTSKDVLNDPYRLNSKSALQEWCQGKGLKIPKYEIKEISKEHGDKKRFFCKVIVEKNLTGEAWGSSRKNAEKKAALIALRTIKNSKLSEDLL